MKILEFKGKISLKNKILIALAIALTISIITIVLIYILNEPARDWINIHILRKEVTEDDIATISLDVDKDEYIHAYDRYISILSNGKLSIYNNYANKEAELDVSISKPTYDTNNNYMAIAETNGQKVYLITDTRVVWENRVEGSISKVNVSRNGSVSVITTGTSYKSVVITFDKNGKELFKTYLASTIVVDTDVSVDGKYLAIAEVNTSGALIESSVKVIDFDKAIKGDATNSVIYRYNADTNKMIINLKYVHMI